MKHLKPINEFWNPFKKKSALTFEEIEAKTEELVYILYDIFDENNISDGNNYYAGNFGKEPDYPFWRYARYALNKSNPRDRIVITIPWSSENEYNNQNGSEDSISAAALDLVRVQKMSDDIDYKITKMKADIEDQLGCRTNVYYNLDEKKYRERGYGGRFVISILHDFKLKGGGVSDTGVR